MLNSPRQTHFNEASGMTPQEYCQNKASESGSSFYYSFLSLPDEKRNAIIALYAFCREVDDIVDMHSEPHIKVTKINWWRTEIEQLFNKQPQHPITRALLPVTEQYKLPKEYFLEILNGMEMDLQQVRFKNFKELSLYCYRVASVVGLMSAEVFGYKDRITLKYAHDLGMAFQLTNIIRDVYEDIQRDRLYLPQDEMLEFGIKEDDLRKKNTSDEFRLLMQHQAERAKNYYKSAFALLPEADRFAQKAGLIMASIYESLLDEIIHDNYDVLNHRIALTPVRKIWLAWKTRRKEKKRHKVWARQNKNEK